MSNRMVDAISRATPRQVPVLSFNLDDVCPSYKDVQSSFLKLKELCMPSKFNLPFLVKFS